MIFLALVLALAVLTFMAGFRLHSARTALVMASAWQRIGQIIKERDMTYHSAEEPLLNLNDIESLFNHPMKIMDHFFPHMWVNRQVKKAKNLEGRTHEG